MASRERGGDEGGAEIPDPPLHVLSEDKYGEVVLERFQEEVELPLFQELEEVKLKPSIFGLMCKELVVAPCIDLFARTGIISCRVTTRRMQTIVRHWDRMRLPMCGTREYVCMLTRHGR